MSSQTLDNTAGATRLGALLSVRRGQTVKAALAGDSGPQLLGMGVFRPEGGFRPHKVRRYTGDVDERGRVEPGDVLVATTDMGANILILGRPARIPASIGTYAVVPSDVGVVEWKTDNPIERDYAYWAMRTDRFRQYCLKRMTGTAVRRVRPRDIEDFDLPRPSAASIGGLIRLLNAIDDRIELNRKMNRTLEEMAQAIFKSWFVDFESEQDCRVQDLIDARVLLVNDGYRAKRSELASTGLPFARAGNINDGFRFDGAEQLGSDGVKRANHKVSEPFDVVFTSKGTVGRFAFVMPTTRQFAYSPQLCFWRSTDHHALSPFFLLYWMRSPAFLLQVAAVKGQTDMAEYVSLRDQRRMRISVPPPAKQAELEASIRPLLERRANATTQSYTLARLRDALLPRLISGEIRVPEAEEAVEAAL